MRPTADKADSAYFPITRKPSNERIQKVPDIGKFDFQSLFENDPQQNLRNAAKAYLNTSIELYIKLEGWVSIIWVGGRFGDSANLVCSLNRAIEHLLKLRLLKIDPLLVYPFPKNIKEYCQVKQIGLKGMKKENRALEREILSHTISFKEAVERVDTTQRGSSFDFRCFKEIYALRNSLEHHWDRNEEFLQKIVGQMSSRVIPCLKEFIKDVLNESPQDYFKNSLLEEVERLDRAFERGHSLALQRRFEEHLKLFREDPVACREKSYCPERYSRLEEYETEAECPVCQHQFMALYDWEADYDVEGSTGEAFVVGATPDVKCLFCNNCYFFVEGRDVNTYLPEGIKIDLDEDYYEQY